MTNANDLIIESCINAYKEEKFPIEQFMLRLVSFFSRHPRLSMSEFPTIHSLKYRLKDEAHLKDKLIRKLNEGRDITIANFFDQITDLAGIRVLHLYPRQFSEINNEIEKQIKCGEWTLAEQPKSYTWDPEAARYFESIGLKVEVKESYYTSVHYLITPKAGSRIKCEIQIRTLFEEVWGEIDHQLNYPEPCKSIACREQLRVLSKLISTGSRLSESIIESHEEYGSLTR